MKFPLIPFEIGFFEGDELTSSSNTSSLTSPSYQCSRCRATFRMTPRVEESMQQDQVEVLSARCLNCMASLTFAGDVTYPSDVQDYH